MSPLALLLPLLAASVPGSARLTLEEATARALARSPRIVAARHDASAAAQAASEARARRFGAIDLVGAYNRYESDRLVRPMAIDLFSDPARGFSQLPWDAEQLHYGVAWQLPLLAGGALSEGQRIARLGADAHVAALERDAADADLKVKLGTWASADAEKVRFALAGAQAEREALRAQSRAAQATLAALMGDEPSPEGYALADVPDEGRGATPAAPPEQAPAQRADLAAVRSQTAAAERREALAKKSFGPEVALTRSRGPRRSRAWW